MQTNRAGSVAGAFVAILLLCWTAESAPPERKELTPPKSGSPFVSPEIQTDGKITFRLRAPKAEKVSVICEAVGKQPMAKDAEGVWSVTVGPVPPGIYDCQFDVDGLERAPEAFIGLLHGQNVGKQLVRVAKE